MTPDQDTKLNVVAEKTMGWEPDPNVANFWVDEKAELVHANSYLLTGNGEKELFLKLISDGYQVVLSTDCTGDGVTAWINKGDTTKTAKYASHKDRSKALLNAAYKLEANDD